MHILGSLFFMTALFLAVGVIIASMANNKDKIVSALLGKNLGSLRSVRLVSNRPTEVRTVGMSHVANENFSLPLAA